MQSFKKLLKGITGGIITIFVLAIILLVLVIICGVRTSFAYLVGMFLFYLIIMAFACTALIIYGVIVFSTYKRERNKLMSVPGFSPERFERETARFPQISDVLLCSDAICYSTGGFMVKTIPIKDIVWAFQEEKQGTMSITIYTVDKERFSVPVFIKKKYGTRDMASRCILRLIARKNKGALIGYNDSFEAMCKNSFDQLLMQTRGGEIIDSGMLEQEYIKNNYYEKDFQ